MVATPHGFEPHFFHILRRVFGALPRVQRNSPHLADYHTKKATTRQKSPIYGNTHHFGEYAHFGEHAPNLHKILISFSVFRLVTIFYYFSKSFCRERNHFLFPNRPFIKVFSRKFRDLVLILFRKRIFFSIKMYAQ